MDRLHITIRKADGRPVVDSEVSTALGLLRTKLSPDPTATLHTYGLRSGAFEAIADVAEGLLSEAVFQGFVDDLLPMSVVGWVTLQDDRGNTLLEAAIGETEVEGKTHPTPPPRESTWTIPRK